jgi:hypothetical protein
VAQVLLDANANVNAKAVCVIEWMKYECWMMNDGNVIGVVNEWIWSNDNCVCVKRAEVWIIDWFLDTLVCKWLNWDWDERNLNGMITLIDWMVGDGDVGCK